MKDHGFKQKMQQKTDDELLAIVQSGKNEFQQEALIDAAAVLRERGIEFQEPEISSPEEKAASTGNALEVPYGPLIVGILMVLLAFYQPDDAGNYEAAFTVNLTLNIFIRAIVMIWSHNLATRFGLNKVLWVILGLVFGGWTLIAITVAIGMKLAPGGKVKPESLPEDSGHIPTHDDTASDQAPD